MAVERQMFYNYKQNKPGFKPLCCLFPAVRFRATQFSEPQLLHLYKWVEQDLTP